MNLINADCLDILDTLPEKSVDILYTDPPYIPPEHSKTLTKYKKTLSILAGKIDVAPIIFEQVLKKIKLKT